MEEKEVLDRFVTSVSGGPPTTEQQNASNRVREFTIDLAEAVNKRVPDGRYKSLALTALEEALMWANKGIFNQQ